MSKITFRADDDLVEQLEELDASKSEAMREALRSFLDDGSSADAERDEEPSIDDLVEDRVDELLSERLDLDTRAPTRDHYREPQDVNVTISLEGDAVRTVDRSGVRVDDADQAPASDAANRGGGRHELERDSARETRCGQCGEHVDGDHVYCPNCGEKASRRLFCDCGDELRSDWSFCPGCGRRTPAADVLGRDPPK